MSVFVMNRSKRNKKTFALRENKCMLKESIPIPIPYIYNLRHHHLDAVQNLLKDIACLYFCRVFLLTKDDTQRKKGRFAKSMIFPLNNGMHISN